MDALIVDKRRNGTPLPSAIPRPDWLRRPALKRPVNAIQASFSELSSNCLPVNTPSNCRAFLSFALRGCARFVCESLYCANSLSGGTILVLAGNLSE